MSTFRSQCERIAPRMLPRRWVSASRKEEPNDLGPSSLSRGEERRISVHSCSSASGSAWWWSTGRYVDGKVLLGGALADSSTAWPPHDHLRPCWGTVPTIVPAGTWQAAFTSQR